MSRTDSEMFEVTLEYRRETANAYGFFQGDYEDTVDGEGKELWVWLPKSQIEVAERKGAVWTVMVPEWLAQEKELV